MTGCFVEQMTMSTTNLSAGEDETFLRGDLDSHLDPSPLLPWSRKVHRATIAAVILGLLVCVALALFPPNSQSFPMNNSPMKDSIGLSYGGYACCHGGCRVGEQCPNCGDTPGGHLSKDQCKEWNGTWCQCACSSGGQSCSEA